jgi:hypothetical protein
MLSVPSYCNEDQLAVAENQSVRELQGHSRRELLLRGTGARDISET